MNQIAVEIPVIDKHKCSGCKKCVSVCKNDVLSMHEINHKSKKYFFTRTKLKVQISNLDNCTSCGSCIAICRHKAIKFN